MSKPNATKFQPVGGDDLWLDLGFSEEESAALRIRADLFRQLQKALKASGKTQTVLAVELGTDQPKISKILKGKLSEFSTDRIIEHLDSMGLHVEVTTSPAAKKPTPLSAKLKAARKPVAKPVKTKPRGPISKKTTSRRTAAAASAGNRAKVAN